MKYEKNYPWHKRLFWDTVLLGGFYWYKVWSGLKDAAGEVAYRFRPKDPTVESYAEFMRKKR